LTFQNDTAAFDKIGRMRETPPSRSFDLFEMHQHTVTNRDFFLMHLDVMHLANFADDSAISRRARLCTACNKADTGETESYEARLHSANVIDEPTGPASFVRWRLSEKGRTINPLALAAGSPFGTGELKLLRVVAYPKTEERSGLCGFPTADHASHSCSPVKFIEQLAAAALRQHN
jgi:hypothetical protein